MKTVANVLLGLTTLVCAIVLVLSVYPGLLNDFWLLAAVLLLFIVPPLGIGSVATLMYLARAGMLVGERIPWIRALLTPAAIVATVLLVKYEVPRRAAFTVWRPGFEQLAEDAPLSATGVALDRLVGPYYIDQYAADPRGGTYFRIYNGADVDVTFSYGFVHQPNMFGSPFGSSRYRTHQLARDWYWFRASDSSLESFVPEEFTEPIE